MNFRTIIFPLYIGKPKQRKEFYQPKFHYILMPEKNGQNVRVFLQYMIKATVGIVGPLEELDR